MRYFVLSMLITLVALLLLGPNVIFGFTAAITLGIFVGTYSSIYVAAPVLILWPPKRGAEKAAARTEETPRLACYAQPETGDRL